jgi:hypothetical protein
MPLKAPARLPKHLRRRASPLTRSLAHKYCQVPDRRARRRKEIFVRFSRKAAKFGSFVASEFRIWMLIGAGTAIAGIIAILLFAPFFDVREMHVKRQDPRIDPEEIQEALSPLFKQRLVLVTRGQVEAMLQAVYPDVERVEIGKQYPSTLNVTVYLEPVAAQVKIDEGDLQAAVASGAVLTGSGALEMYSYVTRSGFFVTSPIRLTSSPLPVLTITDWAIRPQNRTVLLQPDFLQDIFLARDTLRRDFGLTTANTIVYLRAQEFHIRTNKLVLWFDLRSPLTVQFQRFRRFLKEVPIDQTKEYVDLRIADKIVYK